MFEAWGRVIYRGRRLTLVVALVLVAFAAVWGTGVFGKLIVRQRLHPAGQPEPAEADLAAQAFGRNDADVVVLYRSAAMTVADPAYRQAVTAALAACRAADVAKVTHVLDQRVARPGLRRPARDLRGAPARRRPTTPRRHQTYKAIKAGLTPASLAAGRPDRPGRRQRADRGRDQHRGHRRHRPGRGLLDAGAADPAAGHLRQPGARPACRWRSAASRSSARSPCCGCSPWSPRVDLLGQHHHDPRPRPGHRLRAVHGDPVPRGTAPPADRRGRPWPGRWPPRAARSRSPASRSPSRWPA